MSRQKTTQVIHSRDQQWLEDMQEEVTEYRGLRTTLTQGRLTIFLIDSDKYWRKRNRKKRKPEYESDDYRGADER